MTPAPLRLGALTLDPPVMLAPMAGLTDAAMRLMSLEGGAALAFTEVVNADALARGSRRTAFLLETFDGECPVVAHFYGRDPAVMAEAARWAAASGRFAAIDVNCGCPVRKIVAKGCGAALMAEPARIGAIVRAMREASGLPVTVKTRIGWAEDRRNAGDIARAAEDAGAAALIVHGRYAVNRHGGPADWEAIAEIKRGCGIPVVGNGGVQEAADVTAMIERTGVDGVMIGRAAIGNPWIFGVAERPAPPDDALRAAIERHYGLLVAMKTREKAFRRRAMLPPEDAAALVFRPHLFKYLRGAPRLGELRRRLDGMRSRAALFAALEDVLA